MSNDEAHAEPTNENKPVLAIDEDDEVDLRYYGNDSKIFLLKTQVGKETRVAEAIVQKSKKFGFPLLSVLAPADLRGFIFIETQDFIKLEKGLRGITYARGLLKRTEDQLDSDGIPQRDRRGKVVTITRAALIDFETDVKRYLAPVNASTRLSVGDLVDIVKGPFNGERAMIERINEAHDEITLSLVGSKVPIPITVRAESVRVLEKAAQE